MAEIETLIKEPATFESFDLYRRGAEICRHARRTKSKAGILGVNFADTVKIRAMVGSYAAMQVRQEIMQRVESFIPESHMAGWGVDGLFICIPEYGTDDLLNIAQKMIEALNKPYEFDGFRFDVAPKISICEYPGVMGFVNEYDLSRIWGAYLDIALSRHQQINVFTEADYQEINDRQRIDHRLMRALSNDEFYLVYQPRVDMTSKAVIGCEALLRWHNPELGQISPGEFIPRTEATGVIQTLTPWVIEQACKDSLRLGEKYGADFSIGINLSPANLHAPNLIEKIHTALEDTGANPSMLDFEITESLLLEHKSLVIDQLNAMRAEGAKTALDDFGTGFSSLNMLTRIPLDVLKIDKSFIQRLNSTDEADAQVVRAIKDLGQACGLQVIAEGMETAEQVDILVNELGVSIGQGFYFGRPVALDEFMAEY